MNSLKQFLATPATMLAADSAKYYYEIPRRVKYINHSTPVDVAAKAKRKKKNKAVKKAKIASRKHK